MRIECTDPCPECPLDELYADPDISATKWAAACGLVHRVLDSTGKSDVVAVAKLDGIRGSTSEINSLLTRQIQLDKGDDLLGPSPIEDDYKIRPVAASALVRIAQDNCIQYRRADDLTF